MLFCKAKIGASSNQNIWYKLLGRKDFLYSNEFIQKLSDILCNYQPSQVICTSILYELCGPSKYFNESREAVYLTHTPAGTSVKNVLHFTQLIQSDQFQMYNYGAEENMKRYNQTTAPLYDLTRVNVPVALYWGYNDWLADPIDVKFLQRNLPNIVDDLGIVDYDHLDFIWAINANTVLYERMIKLIGTFVCIIN